MLPGLNFLSVRIALANQSFFICVFLSICSANLISILTSMNDAQIEQHNAYGTVGTRKTQRMHYRLLSLLSAHKDAFFDLTI